MAYALPPRPTTTAPSTDWTTTTDHVAQERVRLTTTPSLEDITERLDLQRLCRYAARALPDHERADAQDEIAQNSWALQRLSALLRAQDQPLARRTLDAAAQGHVDPYRTLALAILDHDGHDPSSLDQPPEQPSPTLQAARALTQQPNQAPQLLPSSHPLLPLTQRLASSQDPDHALTHILNSF